MHPDNQPSFEQVVDLSHRMLAMAQAQDWEALQTLESERQPMLERAYAHAPKDRGSEWMRRTTETLLALNEQIVALTAKARENAADESIRMNRSRRATEAYARFG